MGNLDSEYPTDEQMVEMFGAWKKDGQAGIRVVLEKRRRERQEAEAREALENAKGGNPA